MATVADADFVGSACEMDETVTVADSARRRCCIKTRSRNGSVSGIAACDPFTCHVTAVLVVFVTVR